MHAELILSWLGYFMLLMYFCHILMFYFGSTGNWGQGPHRFYFFTLRQGLSKSSGLADPLASASQGAELQAWATTHGHIFALICYNIVKIFCIFDHEVYWWEVFFSSNVFVYLFFNWADTGFTESVLKHRFCFSFLEEIVQTWRGFFLLGAVH